MPAIDQCHQQVVRAQRVRDNRQEVILVEVKCFPEDSSSTRQLYTALGQYLVYRSMVRQKALEAEVYLAVTSDAFDGVISQLGLPAIRENRVKMMVVGIRNEVIRQWL